MHTGSDMPVTITMPLQQSGLLGEETVDNSVWITKTHYPHDSHKESPFTADKIICLTRHPIDVFPSMASLVFTFS